MRVFKFKVQPSHRISTGPISVTVDPRKEHDYDFDGGDDGDVDDDDDDDDDTNTQANAYSELHHSAAQANPNAKC